MAVKAPHSAATPHQRSTFFPRTVLRTNATSSLTGPRDGAEASAFRINTLITNFLTDRVIQFVLDMEVSRSPTTLQGARGKTGMAARHVDIMPGIQDRYLEKVADAAADGCLGTPRKRGVLKALQMTSPQIEELGRRGKRRREDAVSMLYTHTSPARQGSILARTHYEAAKNLTVESVTRANHYDTVTERHMRPIADALVDRQSRERTHFIPLTEEFIFANKQFYIASIAKLTERVSVLERYFALEVELTAFREKFQDNRESISDEEYVAFFEQVSNILKLRASLLTKQVGAPTFYNISDTSPYFLALRRLHNEIQKATSPSSYPELVEAYVQARYEKKPRPMPDRVEVTAKFHFYLQEARQQQKALYEYTEVGTSIADRVQQLFVLIFGVFDDAVRRAPTEEELREHVFTIVQTKRAFESPAKPPLPRSVIHLSPHPPSVPEDRKKARVKNENIAPLTMPSFEKGGGSTGVGEIPLPKVERFPHSLCSLGLLSATNLCDDL